MLVGELVDEFDDADDTAVAMADDGVADSGEEPVVGVEREEWPRCLQELDGLSRTHYRMHRSLD